MGMLRFGQLAPDFEAETTVGNIKLSDYRGKWVVLFSHPRGFHPSMYNRVYCLLKSKYVFSTIKYLFTSA